MSASLPEPLRLTKPVCPSLAKATVRACSRVCGVSISKSSAMEVAPRASPVPCDPRDFFVLSVSQDRISARVGCGAPYWVN
jgi:hypothetical protein